MSSEVTAVTPRPWRSVLFVPADRPDRIRKAVSSAADLVAVDLEDAVDPANKTAARQQTRAVLDSLEADGREIALRINGPGSGLMEADLDAIAILRKPPDLIMVAKITVASELAGIANRLQKCGLGCRLIACIESARAVLHAPEIAAAHERVVGVLFGGHDLSAELGVAYSWEPLLFARSQIVLAACAAGIVAIDAPWVRLDDLEGLDGECLRARQVGFGGKAAIHPKQLDSIHAAFSPSGKELIWAQAVLASAEAAGHGAVRLGRCMIDAAVVRLARRVVAAAELSHSGESRRPGTPPTRSANTELR